MCAQALTALCDEVGAVYALATSGDRGCHMEFSIIFAIKLRREL